MIISTQEATLPIADFRIDLQTLCGLSRTVTLRPQEVAFRSDKGPCDGCQIEILEVCLDRETEGIRFTYSELIFHGRCCARPETL